MTVKELSKLYWLNREVEWNTKELAALEAEIAKDEEQLYFLRRDIDGLASPNLDGMPHGSNVSSPVESKVFLIMRLEDALRRKREAQDNLQARMHIRQTLVILERDRLMRYIDAIPKPDLQEIFRFRFINGLSWEQVAASMGEGYLPDSVKKACYRYIRKH